MTTPPSTAGPLRPELTGTRALDAFACWLLRSHPATASTLVWYGLFERPRAAGKCLRRLLDRGLVRRVGTISRGMGRPEHVFCGWQPAPEALLREVRLTELCRRLRAGDIRRGPEVADRRILPHAEAVLRGTVHYLELVDDAADPCASLERLRRYRDCPHPSLWLCGSPERAEELRRHAAGIPGRSLFAALEEAVPAPHAPVWRDLAGRRTALPG